MSRAGISAASVVFAVFAAAVAPVFADAEETPPGAKSAVAKAEPEEEAPIDPSTLDKRLSSLFLDRRECSCFGISASGFTFQEVSDAPGKTFEPLDGEKLDMQAVYRSLATMKTETDALMTSEDMNTAKAHMSALDAAVRQYEKVSKAGREASGGAYLRLVLRLLREKPSAPAKTLLASRAGTIKSQCKLADYHLVAEAMRCKPEWLDAGELGYVVPTLPEAVGSMFLEGTKNIENNKRAFVSALEKKCLNLWTIFATACTAAENLKASETTTAANKSIGQLEKAMSEYETLRLRPCGRAAYGPTEKAKIKAEVSAGYEQMLESILGQVSEPAVQKQIAPKLEAAKKKSKACASNAAKAVEKEAAARRW